MIYVPDSDDPSPIKCTRKISRAFKNIFQFSRISAIFIVSCFLFVSFVYARSESNDVVVDGRDSAQLTTALCAFDKRLYDQKKNNEENAIMHAVCAVHAQQDSTPFAQRLRTYVKGYPIEVMADALAAQDPVVAAYMIAMAKQESNWGRRVPHLNGHDCYNYWGFRAKRARMGTGGHTCFNSPEDAVETVARRVHELVYDYGRTTPRQMLIWKCGKSCATHNPAGVERWVSVVGRYYAAVMKLAQSDAENKML